MKYEYFRFEDSNRRMNELTEGARYQHEDVEILVCKKEKKTFNVYQADSPFLPQPTTVFHFEILDKGMDRRRRVWMSFRSKSGIVMLETEGDIVASDLIYTFFTTKLGFVLEPIEPGRDRLKEFIDKVTPLELKVETWKGLTDVDEFEESQGDPLLRYSLSLARLLLDCDGKTVITFTLDSIQFEDSVSDEQRECAFQIIERYLAT